MNEAPDTSRLPGYITYLRQWAGVHLRKAFIWSVSAHLVLFAAFGIWWRLSGVHVSARPIVLREWQNTPRLMMQNIPIILQSGGGGGPGSMEAPPGPGKGGTPPKTAPLAIPVPVPDDEISDPEATIATQEEARTAAFVTDEKGDSAGTGGGGGGGGEGGGYGTGTGTGVGEGVGFGNAAFETPPIPVKIVMPAASRGMAKKASRVAFMLLVDESGAVIRDKIFESSGFAALDSLAADAVRQSRFIPAKRKGKAIMAWTRYEVSFKQ